MDEAVDSLRGLSCSLAINAFFDRLFDPVFSLYVFSTIFLPGSSLFGVNLKLPLYLLLLPLAFRKFLQRNPINVSMLAMVVAIPALLSFWVVEGLVNGFEVRGVVRQYTDIVLTLLMCWLVYLFCEEREDGRLRFLRLVLNSEVATCLFKAGIVLYALVRGIPVFVVVREVSQAFGVDLMTMDLGALFGRVQFVSDALIPICVFIVLRYRDRLRIAPLRASVTIILLLLSVLASFSRYFWADAAIALVLGLLLGKKDRFKAGLMIALGALIVASLPVLSNLYQLRFSEGVANSSDSHRDEQKLALIPFIEDAPILGHGLGSFTTQLIRSTDIPYGYEMQLVALTGQIGIIGITFLAILLGCYYRRIVFSGWLSLSDRIALAILLVVWISAGMYNPIVEGAVASISYACFAAMSGLARKFSWPVAASAANR